MGGGGAGGGGGGGGEGTGAKCVSDDVNITGNCGAISEPDRAATLKVHDASVAPGAICCSPCRIADEHAGADCGCSV